MPTTIPRDGDGYAVRIPYGQIPPSRSALRALGDRDRRIIRRVGARTCREIARSYRRGEGARSAARWHGVTNPRTMAAALRAGIALLAAEKDARDWWYE